MTNEVVKIGLLGVGKMGQNHLRNLIMLKQVEIIFIYDIDLKATQQIASLYNVRVSENLDEDLKKVDGVIIVTPTFTHYDYIQHVSQFVKNIFVEKPLTDTVESSRQIVRLADEKKLNIQVGFIERYNSAVTALQRVIKNSDHIINIDFFRTNKVSNRITDVDVVIDLMIHDIDLALLINGKPKKIEAHGYIQGNMIEYARAIITHENGAFSSIVASRITEKRMRQISATCSDMYIDCNLLSKEILVNKQSIEQYLDDVTIASKSETIDVRGQEGLLLELLDFIKLCQGEKVQAANELDGLAAMEVAGKIQELIMASES